LIWLRGRAIQFYRRQIRPKPWDKPFVVSSGEVETFTALKERLDEVEVRVKEWATIYRDRHTGQFWRLQSADRGPDTFYPISASEASS